MSEMDFVMNMMREEANKKIFEKVKNGELTLENDDVGLIPPFLAANLVSNPQILDVLETMNLLIMEDKTMEKEYVSFFINKLREIGNKGLNQSELF